MDTPIYKDGMCWRTAASTAAKTREEFLAAMLNFLFANKKPIPRERAFQTNAAK